MAGTDEFAVGDRLLGKLRIDGVLGEGGMGTVYAAYHEVLACPVALKVIRAGATDKSLIERFVREVRVCALLQNEHVARVMDAGVLDGGSPYMIMELLQGKTLGELQKLGERFNQRDSVDLILQAMEGLAEAHAKGVVHRDVKPDNLFLAMHGLTKMPPWTVKLLDFGISKADLNTGRKGMGTEATAVLGTPEYMSPEQLKSSRSVDHRADIWSLGVILYELLSGRRPFVGETAGAVFAAILQDEAPSLTLANVPPDLAETVASCLHKDIDQRPADLEALARRLAPYCSPSGTISIEEIGLLQTRRMSIPAAMPAGPLAPTEPAPRELVDRRLIPTRITSATDLDTVTTYRRPSYVSISVALAIVFGLIIGGVGMSKLFPGPSTTDSSAGTSAPVVPPDPSVVPTPLRYPPAPLPLPPSTAVVTPSTAPLQLTVTTPVPPPPSARPAMQTRPPPRPAGPAPLATDRHQF